MWYKNEQAEPHVLPTHFHGFVANDVKLCTNHEGPTQSKLKKKFSVGKRRNDLKSHISTVRDEGSMCGESGMSCSSDVPWTTGVASPSGDVEPNPCPPRARSGGGRRVPLC